MKGLISEGIILLDVIQKSVYINLHCLKINQMDTLSFDRWQARHQRLLDIQAKFVKFMRRKNDAEEEKDSDALDRLIDRIHPKGRRRNT